MNARLKPYEASTFSDHVMPYHCVHCHYETTARSFAYAKGGISPYGLDDRGAEALADRYARVHAAARAAISIRIAPCPRCHRRDREAVVQVYRVTLVACAAMIGFAIAIIAWSGQPLGRAMVVGSALAAIPALLLWKHRTSQLSSGQVRFDVQPEASPAVTPARPRG
jgi:Flp pilus assembly protein TadB